MTVTAAALIDVALVRIFPVIFRINVLPINNGPGVSSMNVELVIFTTDAALLIVDKLVVTVFIWGLHISVEFRFLWHLIFASQD